MDMEQLAQVVKQVSDFVWNNLLLYLLVLTGVLFSVRTHFVQVRHLGTGLKRMFGSFSLNGKKADHEGMSSFQALTTAMTGTIFSVTEAIRLTPPRKIKAATIATTMPT